MPKTAVASGSTLDPNITSKDARKAFFRHEEGKVLWWAIGTLTGFEVVNDLWGQLGDDPIAVLIVIAGFVYTLVRIGRIQKHWIHEEWMPFPEASARFARSWKAWALWIPVLVVAGVIEVPTSVDNLVGDIGALVTGGVTAVLALADDPIPALIVLAGVAIHFACVQSLRKKV